MLEKKLDGESNTTIKLWLEEQHSLVISERQLWNFFKNYVPDFIYEVNRKKSAFLDDESSFLEHIKELEKVAEMQLERIKAQRWDEIDQEGIGRLNPQTGEIEYAATNKNLNDSIRTYNSLIKNILDMKASVGLIKKQSEVIEIKASMNTPANHALKNMILDALKTGPELNKFIQEIPVLEYSEVSGDDNVKALLESNTETAEQNRE